MKMNVKAAVALCLILFTCTILAAQCTPTGFYRDGINMTALLINPPTVTGDVDASGCNIAVYYDQSLAVPKGTIDTANIHGANYFGVLVNGDAGSVAVNITDSTITQIGETPFNGTQHGVAIYYRAFFPQGSANGTISGNTISDYQKGAIVANGRGTNVSITENIVNGLGPVPFIAQNGIQVGYGASASVMHNTVSGNSYTGDNFADSGGIIAVGGAGYGECPDGNACPYTTGTRIMDNTVLNNDVGIWLTNVDASFDPPATPTNIKAVNNMVKSDAVNNVGGFGPNVGYQAGIADQGYNDKLINNTISGAGYDPASAGGSTPYIYSIDADPAYTNNAKVHANSVP